MGVVYKAFDEKLQRTVALKFLAGESKLTEADRNRLLREARAASVLDHENIVSIHAIEEASDGRVFIVMGFYEGENLATRMGRAPLSIEQSVRVVRQVAQGLAHAHQHNVVHRDIKPSNVILCSDGTAKIVDFGLARVLSEDETQSIGVSGTLPYMSPEQVTGKTVDHRTDIWSLGVMMYELLMRHHPFSADSPAAMIAAIAKAQPPAMDSIPEGLQAIVYRAMAKRPEDRYQSCVELLSDVDAWRGSDVSTLALTDDLKRRMGRSGTSAARGIDRYAKWLIIAVILLMGLILSAPVRNLMSGHGGRGNAAAKTTPAAYESYEKGTKLLQAFYRLNANDSAIQEFNTAIQADPKFALAYIGLGQAYYNRYRLERVPKLIAQAEEYAKTALALNNQLGDVYILLGRIQLALGNQAVALSQLQQAIQLDPKSSPAHLALADAYSAMGRTADADRAYERGIALDAESWDGYYRRAVAYYSQQRYEEAAAQFRKAIEIAPDNPYAHTNLAVMLKELHREPEAEAELKKALDYGEVYSAYGNLANLYYQQKRFPEAVELTKRALRKNQNDYMLWNNLGVYYDAIGDKASANDAYQHVFSLLEEQVRLNPRDATMRSDLALQYSKRNVATKALSHIQTALALQPKDTRVLQIAGEIYYNLGDRSKAISYMRESVMRGNTVEELDRDPDLRLFLSDPDVRKGLERAQLSARSTAAKKTAN
jgi:tetratricopeptide (TPR) repeat protein